MPAFVGKMAKCSRFYGLYANARTSTGKWIWIIAEGVGCWRNEGLLGYSQSSLKVNFREPLESVCPLNWVIACLNTRTKLGVSDAGIFEANLWIATNCVFTHGALIAILQWPASFVSGGDAKLETIPIGKGNPSRAGRLGELDLPVCEFHISSIWGYTGATKPVCLRWIISYKALQLRTIVNCIYYKYAIHYKEVDTA